MTTIKQALIKIGRDTNRLFHIAANFNEQSSAIDIVSVEGGFSIMVETPTSTKQRTFKRFSELCEFIAQENLLKVRCFIRLF